MKKIIWSQFIALLIGTVFAWFNFLWEFFNWMQNKVCTTGCVVNQITNPFLTPCFFGALFFAIAFVLNIIILKKQKELKV